tara:strand:- start:432 stop:626 length:195 start_codon:yes stop_codon:yes gene_type:complete
MAHAASGIGLQNPAFFVGRAELLDWVNGLLNLKLMKVEQVSGVMMRTRFKRDEYQRRSLSPFRH